jgi:hypothetical protein
MQRDAGRLLLLQVLRSLIISLLPFLLPTLATQEAVAGTAIVVHQHLNLGRRPLRSLLISQIQTLKIISTDLDKVLRLLLNQEAGRVKRARSSIPLAHHRVECVIH